MLITFVTWDGPSAPYLQSLYLPLMARMSRENPSMCFQVLQFGWGDEDYLSSLRRVAREYGIKYELVKVKRPSRAGGVATTLMLGAVRLRRFSKSSDVVLARSVLPVAVALLARRLGLRSALCFDADGSMPDERREFAGWSEKKLSFRAIRAIQNRALLTADSILTRTTAGIELFESALGNKISAPIVVVPNGRSETAFSPANDVDRANIRARFGVAVDALWVIALGAVGQQYLPKDTCRMFERLKEREPKAVMHWFCPHPDLLRRELGEQIPVGIHVGSLEPEEVGSVLGSADIGLALRALTPSQRAVSPVKVAEFLLSGLAVVVSPVGDLAVQLADSDAARIVKVNDPDKNAEVIDWMANQLDPAVRNRSRRSSRELGQRWFSLEQMLEGYEQGVLTAFSSLPKRHC